VRKGIALILITLALALVSAGCAAGITLSAKPQFTVQGCLLGAEPLIIGQADIEAWAWGINDEWILLGAPTRVPYGQRSPVS